MHVNGACYLLYILWENAGVFDNSDQEALFEKDCQAEFLTTSSPLKNIFIHRSHTTLLLKLHDLCEDKYSDKPLVVTNIIYYNIL